MVSSQSLRLTLGLTDAKGKNTVIFDPSSMVHLNHAFNFFDDRDDGLQGSVLGERKVCESGNLAGHWSWC